MHLRKTITRSGFGLSCLLVAVFVSGSNPGFAQTAGAEANPGQIERRIEDSAPITRPRDEPRTDIPALPGESGDQDQSFVLAAVSISGVETLPPEAIAPAYEELLASLITLSDAAEIANRITSIYRERGYALSRAFVPPQVVEGGVLRIVVAEGHVSDVTFSGADDLATDLNPYLAAVLNEKPLKLATLERAILLINDLAGVRVLRSGLTEPEEGSGAFLLQLEIEYDGADATAYLDNRGTPSVGRLQSWLSGGLNSQLGMGERIQVGVFTVPNQPEELLYKEASYLQPLGGNGTEFFLSGSHSSLDPGGNLGQLDTSSESVSVILRLTHPVLRSRKESMWLNGFLEYRNSEEQRRGVKNFDDRIRVARLRANYNRGGDSFFVSSILRLSQGLSVLGASTERSGQLSRFDATPNFTKVSAETSYGQDVFGQFSTLFTMSGQKSANSLYSSEEFAVGGNRFGRAYDFAEITGEDGAAGSLELRYSVEERPDGFEFLQFYSFYDFGAVWNRNADSAFRRHSLSSTGLGVRANFVRSIQTSFEVAQPLTRPVFTSGNDTGPRYFFSLSTNF